MSDPEPVREELVSLRELLKEWVESDWGRLRIPLPMVYDAILPNEKPCSEQTGPVERAGLFIELLCVHKRTDIEKVLAILPQTGAGSRGS